MIEIKDISFSYPGQEEPIKKAVDHLSLTIEQGEFIAILGHNGSGKSTLAKLMNGLLLPNEGEVRVEGLLTTDEERLWDIRAKAGVVFQNPDNQIVATTVEEDVAFGSENLGIPRDELRKRVDRALEIVEMEEYKRHAPHLLSGGQKQRVAIAGILAMEPDYIILDEPTAMLDPNGRKEVMDTILHLNEKEKKTIILVTHYMDEAAMAKRLVVMEKGKIILDGEPRKVFSHVEQIKAIGLDVPQVTEIAYELQKEGVEVSTEILTVEELVNALCQL